MIAAGWNVYWQKDVWNFIACTAYEGGLLTISLFIFEGSDCDDMDIFRSTMILGC